MLITADRQQLLSGATRFRPESLLFGLCTESVAPARLPLPVPPQLSKKTMQKVQNAEKSLAICDNFIKKYIFHLKLPHIDRIPTLWILPLRPG
jgi:hypothetical protein